jgi:hypothetical protein
MLTNLYLAALTKPTFLPNLMASVLLAQTSVTQAGNSALGIILFFGAIALVGGIIGAALLGMMGRDMSHIKVCLICAAIGGCAVALVIGFFKAGGTTVGLSPAQPD